jgi:hypothetical protein
MPCDLNTDIWDESMARLSTVMQRTGAVSSDAVAETIDSPRCVLTDFVAQITHYSCGLLLQTFYVL